MIPGIDVSHYQGLIDWQKVKESGIQFAYIKSTDGEYGRDVRRDANLIGSFTAGVPRGAYHFMRIPDVNGQIEFVKAEAALLSCELPFVCDAEVSGLKADDVLTFLDAFPGSILYTDLAMIKEWGEEAKKLTGHRLWLARYMTTGGAADVSPVNPLPESFPWPAWTFWQHTPSGRIPGISTPVDLDWFNGDLQELMSLKG